MTLRLGDLSDDLRHEVWSRVVERIYREQVNQAWNHYMFRLLRAIFTTNEKLADEGGFVFQWMENNYVDAALMLLRRELDQQAGTENLRNLLVDMIDHTTVLSRARYRSQWCQDGPFERGHADRVFDHFNPKRVEGNPDADYIDPDIIRADLDRIVLSAERLRGYAERTRAHRTPEQKVDTAGMTFTALHDAIADVRRVVGKYYSLLTLSSIPKWEPVPQYYTLAPFMRPWVVDRAAVAEAAKEGGEDRSGAKRPNFTTRPEA